MSGGHFNDNNYIYYQVDNFADELEIDIEKNDTPDEWGYYPGLSPEVIAYLRAKIPEIRKIAKIMRHIDYLYSSDHGEETFMKIVSEIEKTDWKG
jgi:hypothetical protein